eukprot:7078159-Prymnesium_polylepis.1
MQPAARTRAQGFSRANPDSPMLAIYAWRRVLRNCGRYLADMALMLKQLKALRKDYVRTFGDFVLVKQQQQPLSRRQRLALLTTCKTYSVPGWSVTRHDG